MGRAFVASFALIGLCSCSIYGAAAGDRIDDPTEEERVAQARAADAQWRAECDAIREAERLRQQALSDETNRERKAREAQEATERKAKEEAERQRLHDEWALPCEGLRAFRARENAKFGDTYNLNRARKFWKDDHCHLEDDGIRVVRTFQEADGTFYQREVYKNAPHVVCDGTMPPDPYMAIKDPAERLAVVLADGHELGCRDHEVSEGTRKGNPRGRDAEP